MFWQAHMCAKRSARPLLDLVCPPGANADGRTDGDFNEYASLARRRCGGQSASTRTAHRQIRRPFSIKEKEEEEASAGQPCVRTRPSVHLLGRRFFPYLRPYCHFFSPLLLLQLIEDLSHMYVDARSHVQLDPLPIHQVLTQIPLRAYSRQTNTRTHS